MGFVLRTVFGEIEMPEGEIEAARASVARDELRGSAAEYAYLAGWAGCLRRQHELQRAEVEREMDGEILDLSRAQPIGDRVAPKVTIRISSEFPKSDRPCHAVELFAEEGQTLEQALWESLPGGTIDALIAALLTRRASRFVVAFGGGERT